MPAQVQTVELEITGMHCQSCAASIKAGVMDLDGVQACEVSLEEHRGSVTVRDHTALEAVTDKIARMGFGVAVREKTAPTEAPASREAPTDGHASRS